MEIDPFGFIEDSKRIPEAQESILSKFPFPRKGGISGVGREEESLTSQEPGYCFTLTESTEIMMVSLPVTQDREAEESLTSQEPGYCFTLTESTEIMMVSLPVTQDRESEEEYHTPPENSAVPSPEEAAGVAAGAERVVDLTREDDADFSQDVLEFRKGGEADEFIVLERKLEKIRALRRKEGSPGSLDGGNVPYLGRSSDSGVLDRGFDSSGASKGKSVIDECLQEYLTKKLRNAEEKLGIVSGNEHGDASGDGLIEVDREMREIGVSKGVDASGGARMVSRRLESREKAKEDNVSGAPAGESDGRVKSATVDGEFGGTLTDNSVKRLKSLKNSGSRDMVEDVAHGISEAVDLDGGRKESSVNSMQILEVNFQVVTPSSSVRIVKEKIRKLLKSMEKLNPQEVIAEGSLRRKSIKKDTIRIIDLEVSERHDGPVFDRDVEIAASHGEPVTGNERHMNLAQKSIEEIEKFRSTAKSFHPYKGKRKCLGEGSDMKNGEVDEFEHCDNLVRKISKSREGIGAGHTNVIVKSSEDAQGLRKLPPSIMGQSTHKETIKGYQSRDPPPQPDAPPQDEIVVIAPSTSDASLPPKVKVPDILKLMKMITGAHVDTNAGTECVVDVVKRFHMNLPRPRWWPERNFELE